jgi:sugar/nucleoside kinase (ribokinase family)
MPNRASAASAPPGSAAGASARSLDTMGGIGLHRHPMPTPLAKDTAKQLQANAARLEKTRSVVGFDGFVDTILQVVKTRRSPTKYDPFAKMGDWAERVGAAAGVSANFEFAQQMVKLGGNGPIMANALIALGTPLTYVGCLGKPSLHWVFSDFAQRATVYSIAEPGYTDALEFEDGKLMFGKHQSLKEVNWANMLQHVPEAKLTKLFKDAGFVAMVNWTMLTNLTEVLQKLLTRVFAKLGGAKRWVFFDLADPAKRSREDLLAVLKLIAKYEKHARVILGLNLAEARQVSEVLGLGPVEETYGTVAHAASRIREALKIDTVVVHPVEFAAASDALGSTHVVGPFTLKPKITTGAGDHFNAGFCIGRILGLGLAESLQVGVATSGYYVRSAKSPKIADLVKFLRTL